MNSFSTTMAEDQTWVDMVNSWEGDSSSHGAESIKVSQGEEDQSHDQVNRARI